MHADNSNFIEPTPEVLSKEVSIYHNYQQQQMVQQEEEEDDIIDLKDTSIKKDKELIESSTPYHNYNQPKEASSIHNSIKHQDITTSSHNHNNNSNNNNTNSDNNNNKNSSKIQTPQPQHQSTLMKQKNNELGHSSTQRSESEVNLNDIQGLTYRYNKELSRIAIPKNEVFMNRMLFDIFKRKEKENKINELIENNKKKIKENERIKGFNRLINDANRRLEVKEHLEENKNKLNEEHVFDHQQAKKYKDDEWKGIYNERFIKFQNEKEKKQIENVKIKKDQERKNEEEVIELCKSKKAPMKIIKENAQRMYDDAIKKRLLKNDQIARREKLNKKDNDVKKLKNDLQAKEQNNKIMRRNLENIIRDDNEEEEDLRNVPNPICQTEGKKKLTNQLNIYMNNLTKDDPDAKYHKLNEKDFFKPSSRMHCDEKEAEQIVQEFFTNKLMKH